MPVFIEGVQLFEGRTVDVDDWILNFIGSFVGGLTEMVNLREKPFYLDDDGVKWVEDTIASMTLDEKVGQLFVLLKHSPDMEKAIYNLKTFHQGGVRWQVVKHLQ